VHIQFGVTLHNCDGPFVIPEGSIVVSSIVWLCISDSDIDNFELDVQLSLAHFLDPTVSDTCKFLQADHRVTEGMRYHFKVADGYARFSKDCAIGVLTTKHFCVNCISTKCADRSRKLHSAALFCLIEGVPNNIPPPSSTWEIVFILCYLLRTCISVSVPHLHA